MGGVHRADPRPARGVLTSTQEQRQGLGANIGFKGSVWSVKQVGILQRSLWLPVGCQGLRPGSLGLEPGLLSAEGWQWVALRYLGGGDRGQRKVRELVPEELPPANCHTVPSEKEGLKSRGQW